MFEIPDDDDLFSEENLKDILSDVSNHLGSPEQDQNVASNVFHQAGQGQMVAPSLSAGEGPEEHLGSPQLKKMRVLTDVNYPPRLAAVVQKPVEDQYAASMRTSVSSNTTVIPSDPVMLRDNAESDVTVLPRRRSLRKFPGPAGILPSARPSELASLMKKSPGTSPTIVSEDSSSKPEEEVSGSQTGGNMFGGAAWQSLVADLQPGAEDVLTKFSVRTMLHKASRRQLPKGKVPLMVGVLDSIDFQGTDASVVLRDRTGQMQGTLHREALKDFSTDLQMGSAVVLRQVSVISPSARTHYLNITAGNIVAIYPASGPRVPTVLLSSLDQAAATQPCQELVKNCVRAAEIELLEAANAAKESALGRLRQRESPAVRPIPVSAGVGASANRSNQSSGLFRSTPFQGPRGAMSSPFTPPRPSQPSSSLTPAHTGRFTFTNTGSASPQMRTPTPDYRTGSYSGNSACRISRANSSQRQNSSIQNSQFSQRHTTPNTLYPRGSAVTGQLAASCVGSGGSWNPSSNQGGSYRLQPSSSCRTNTASNTNPNPPQTIVAVSLSSTSSGIHVPTAGCESDKIQCARLAETSKSTNNPSQSRSAFVSHPFSQQSRWSFKRKACDPPSHTVNRLSDADADSEGKLGFQGKQGRSPDRRVSDSELYKAGDVPQVASAASAGTRHGGAGLETNPATKGSHSIWDDELDDDILSQLSDDF